MASNTRTLRVLSGSYALSSVLAMLAPPLIPITDPSRVVYWAVIVVLCAGVLASTWRSVPLPRVVLVGSGWLLLVLSLYLHFVVGDLLAMLTAMPLSVAVLSLLCGQVTPRTRTALLTLHVACSGADAGSVDGLGRDPEWLIAGFLYAGALILIATILSVYKPWGRTRFGRRETMERNRQRRVSIG